MYKRSSDTIIIDGEKITNMEMFHDFLKQSLDLPDFYGRNFNALWDCLTGGIGFPLTIIWKNFTKSKKYLGNDAELALSVFKDAGKQVKGLRVIVED